MGSSESAQSKPLVDEDEKIEEDQSDQQLQEREKKIQSIEQSIKGDPSVTNVVKQMSELLQLEGDQMDALNVVVNVMGKEWTKIMSEKDNLCKAIGEKEFGELKCLRADYFMLLLETKKVMVGSIEESKIQRENLANLLKILGNATDTGVSNEDIVDFDYKMTKLQKWIDPTALQKVLEKWGKLTTRLEVKKTKMQEVVEKFKKKSFWTKVFVGIAVSLAVIAVVSTLVVLIIYTSGAGATIAAGVVKTTVICGKAFCTAHLVNAGIALGISGAVLASGMVGVAHLWMTKPNEMAKQAQKVTMMLQDMLDRIHQIKGKIGDVQDEEEKIAQRYKYLKDEKKVHEMKTDLQAIDKYLANYQEKGDAAVLSIKEAYNSFVGK